MNSEEIKAAVEQMKAIPCDDRPAAYSVASAFMDMEINVSYSDIGLRNRLIALLRQADPDTHMELPRDADGVHIHVGDVMCCAIDSDYFKSDKRLTVCGFAYNKDGDKRWEWQDEYGDWRECKWWRHYRKPTVEDVLSECCSEYHNAMLMGTCDIPCDVPSLSEVINKYAEKLREVMQDDD